jgi:peptide/nickel transport system substrate-binding protein
MAIRSSTPCLRRLLSRFPTWTAGDGIRQRSIALTTALVAAGCASLGFVGVVSAATPGISHGAAASQTLNIGALYGPLTINPALNGYNVFNSYTLPAYGSMITATPAGKFGPGFAASFGYVGTGNKVFQMTLRHDVRFNDGTLMTANDVAASIRYFQKANGPEASTLSALTNVQTVGKWQVKLTLSSPNPLLPLLFSQEYTSGEIIEGKAIADPSSMSNQTFGAGPYMLDSSNTVLSDHYTYIPNPHYYDKSQVHWA